VGEWVSECVGEMSECERGCGGLAEGGFFLFFVFFFGWVKFFYSYLPGKKGLEGIGGKAGLQQGYRLVKKLTLGGFMLSNVES